MSYSAKLKRSKRAWSPSSGGDAGPRGGRGARLALVLLAVVVVAAAWHWLSRRDQTQPGKVTLTVSAGQATVTRRDGTVEPALWPGGASTLQRGDSVETAAESQARLTFAGGESVTLAAHTRLGVLELNQTGVTRALSAVLALQRGRIIARLSGGLFRSSRFEVQMLPASVTATGGALACEALANDHANVLAYDGAVQVAMGPQALTLQAGQACDIRLGQTLSAVNTGQAIPGGPPEVTPSLAAATATYTEREKTLFPPVITPTRPGDVAAPTLASDEVYTVQQGDTLFSIATKFGISWQALFEANRSILAKPELVRAGQRLRIPR